MAFHFESESSQSSAKVIIAACAPRSTMCAQPRCFTKVPLLIGSGIYKADWIVCFGCCSLFRQFSYVMCCSYANWQPLYNGFSNKFEKWSFWFVAGALGLLFTGSIFSDIFQPELLIRRSAGRFVKLTFLVFPNYLIWVSSVWEVFSGEFHVERYAITLW